MPTSSAKLSLLKPTTTDAFVTADIANNWQKIDNAPGITICTASTRPTWNTNQTGMRIFETDTALEWYWTGTAWARVGPAGMLKTSGGQPSLTYQSATQNNNTPAAFTIMVAAQNIVVPDGLRPLKITATWQTFTASHLVGVAAIFRSAVANSGAVVGKWLLNDDPTTTHVGGPGASYVAWERSGLTAGIYNWSFQFRVTSAGGLATITADSSGGAASIAIEEV